MNRPNEDMQIETDEEDREPGEDIRLQMGGAILGVVFSFDSFICIQEDDYDRCEKEALELARLFSLAPRLLEALREFGKCKACNGQGRITRQSRGFPVELETRFCWVCAGTRYPKQVRELLDKAGVAREEETSG